MRDLRQALPVAAADRASSQAIAEVLALPELQVDRVCCYVSARRELATRELLTALIESGRQVSVPWVDGSVMEARRLPHLDALVPGAFRIPTSEGPRVERVEVAIVPGLAFSPRGERVGYGAGHYDRWLASTPDTVPIGLCFQAQLCSVLPTEPHDLRMQAVATESGVHRGPPERAIRVVAAALVRDGRVLVARRGPGMSQAGCWEFPGGKVEAGEDDPTALARELREELGIDVAVGDPVTEATHPYPGVEITLAAWRCTLASGEPRATEHDALRWVGQHELPALAWAPADLPLIPSVAALLA